MLEVKDMEQSPDAMLFTESLVVAEYVAEQYGQSNNLLPLSAKDRATTRLFTELCGSSTFSYFPLLRARNNEEDFEKALQDLKDGLVCADAFLKQYQSAPFLMGDNFSLAEANAAPFVQRACTILPNLTGSTHGGTKTVDPIEICEEMGLNHLKHWIEAVLNRPSVRATGVSEDKLLESAVAMLERFAAMEKK